MDIFKQNFTTKKPWGREGSEITQKITRFIEWPPLVIVLYVTNEMIVGRQERNVYEEVASQNRTRRPTIPLRPQHRALQDP